MSAWPPGTLTKRMEIIDDALEQMVMAGIPQYMADELRYPLRRALTKRPSRWGGRPRRCYLGFYGEKGSALYLKVGIAAEPKKRLAVLDTGQAHKRLWSFQSDIGVTDEAVQMERALLAHFGDRRGSGEWVRLDGMTEESALDLVCTLAVVASTVVDHPVAFSKIIR